MVLRSIQGLISRVQLLAPDNGLDILRLADCSLRDCLTLIELLRVLTSKRAEVALCVYEVRQLKVQVWAAGKHSEALPVVSACVD